VHELHSLSELTHEGERVDSRDGRPVAVKLETDGGGIRLVDDQRIGRAARLESTELDVVVVIEQRDPAVGERAPGSVQPTDEIANPHLIGLVEPLHSG